jgi:hypothetical protein
MPEAEKYRMGPAAIHYNGQLMDWLTRGAEVVITPNMQAIEFDQDPEYDDVLMGFAAEVRIAVAVKNSVDMGIFIPYINKIVDGDKILYDGVVNAGLSMRSLGKPLLLTALDADPDDASNDCYLPRATCVSPFRIVYRTNEVSILEATFKGYTQDRITRRKIQIGDRTAQADVTAPEVESTSPESGGTGVAKAAGLKIDFVMSEDIMSDTVIKANTLMAKATDQTVFTDYNVSYISATKTIRLTTNEDLAAETEYAVILGMGIKDLNGNPLEPYVLKFTTGA